MTWTAGPLVAGAFGIGAGMRAGHADAAFPHQLFASRTAAAVEPGVAAVQRRMAGKRQSAAGAEDAQPVVGLEVGRRQQEGGLGASGPVGDGPHLFDREAFPVEHYATGLPGLARAGNTSICLNGRCFIWPATALLCLTWAAPGSLAGGDHASAGGSLPRHHVSPCALGAQIASRPETASEESSIVVFAPIHTAKVILLRFSAPAGYTFVLREVVHG